MANKTYERTFDEITGALAEGSEGRLPLGMRLEFIRRIRERLARPEYTEKRIIEPEMVEELLGILLASEQETRQELASSFSSSSGAELVHA